jgi:hypothetical protein
MKAGHDQSQIAKLLDRHISTIIWGFLAIGALKVTGQSKPEQQRPSFLRKARTQP